MRLVHLDGGHDAEEAMVLVSFLNAYGFPSYILNEHHLAAAPHLKIALGMHRLLVVDRDLSDIQQLLKDVVNGPSDSEVNHVTCAECAAIYPKTKLEWTTVIIALFHIMPFALRRRTTHCPNCKTDVPYAAYERTWFRWVALAIAALCAVTFYATCAAN